MNREAQKEAVEAAITAVGFFSEEPNEQAFALAIALVTCSGDGLCAEKLDAAGLRLRVGKALLTLLQTVPEPMQAEVLLDATVTLTAVGTSGGAAS